MKKNLWTKEIDRQLLTSPDARLRESQRQETANGPRDSLSQGWRACREGRSRMVVTVQRKPECGLVPLDDLAALETDRAGDAPVRETLIIELAARRLEGLDAAVHEELLDALNVLRAGRRTIRIVFAENAAPVLAMVDLEDLEQLDAARRPFTRR